jgi:hypothetical protein
MIKHDKIHVEQIQGRHSIEKICHMGRSTSSERACKFKEKHVYDLIDLDQHKLISYIKLP